MEKVDMTIEAICNWIQKNLENENNNEVFLILPQMTKALAELVAAKASPSIINNYSISSNK